MLRIAGADPGKTGAFVVLDAEDARTVTSLAAFPMPTFALAKGTKLNFYELAHQIDFAAMQPIKFAFIELVGSRPGEGVSSAFDFGTSFGAIRMAFAAHFIPAHLVTPPTWKKHFRIHPGAGKDASRQKASEYLPRWSHLWARAKDDGIAEAALIALYGLHTQTESGEK